MLKLPPDAPDLDSLVSGPTVIRAVAHEIASYIVAERHAITLNGREEQARNING